MKIIMHAFIMVFLCLCGSQLEAFNTEPVTGTPVGTIVKPDNGESTVKVKLHVIFGRRKFNCMKFGICDATLEVELDTDKFRTAGNGSYGTAWIENGRLYVEFIRASMSDSVYNTYFPNGRFTMEEDFELPEEMATAMGVRGYTIVAGKYAGSANTEGSTLTVTF